MEVQYPLHYPLHLSQAGTEAFDNADNLRLRSVDKDLDETCDLGVKNERDDDT